jgi:hypothetical protein
MVRALILAARAATRSAGKELYEVTGAVLVVVGLVGLFGAFVGCIAVGVALLGKSLEHDLNGRGGDRG